MEVHGFVTRCKSAPYPQNPKTPLGGSGNGECIFTDTCARLTVQFLYDDEPSAALGLWAYVAPHGTMQHPVLLRETVGCDPKIESIAPHPVPVRDVSLQK